MTQIAASIEYETAPPPVGLPDDMRALPRARLSFLSIKAIDGFAVAAALWQPEDRPPADSTLLLQVHGSGGNLATLPLRMIACGLSPRGYAALTINTRQHDEHVNTDNFFAVRRDIEAAVATAKALGYRSIVLQGHSLGTMQVAFLRRDRLGSGDPGRHPARTVRQAALEVTPYPGPERERLQSLGTILARGAQGRQDCGPPAVRDGLDLRSADAGDGAAFPHLSRRAGKRGRQHLLGPTHPASGPDAARRGGRRHPAVRTVDAAERCACRRLARRFHLSAGPQPTHTEPGGPSVRRHHAAADRSGVGLAGGTVSVTAISARREELGT